jgi:hypothetical protein
VEEILDRAILLMRNWAEIDVVKFIKLADSMKRNLKRHGCLNSAIQFNSNASI